MPSASLYGKVVQKLSDIYGAGPGLLGMNSRGDLRVAQALPARSELVRLGCGYSCKIATASAFAPVAAEPTTLMNLEIFNNNPAGGMSLLIDKVDAFSITSITAASSFTLLGQVVPAPATAPTDDTAQLIVSLSGKVNAAPAVKRAVAQTHAVANKWVTLGLSNGGPAASIGAGASADVYGLIIVPPGASFGVNVIAGTAVGTMVQSVSFYEYQLDLG